MLFFRRARRKKPYDAFLSTESAEGPTPDTPRTGQELFYRLNAYFGKSSTDKPIPISKASTLQEKIEARRALVSVKGREVIFRAALRNPLLFMRLAHHSQTPTNVIKVLQRFATKYELELNDDDIEKAAKVVNTAQFVTTMLGYSLPKSPLLYQLALLYPVTDSFLDNRHYGYQDKVSFCQAINTFIENSIRTKKNDLDTSPSYRHALSKNCLRILSQIDARSDLLQSPRVWRTLLLLNHCQMRSATQQREGANDLSLDELFGLSFDKGAATFKLIMLIMQPKISQYELNLCELFGGLVQLFDDISDLQEDAHSGIWSFAMAFTLKHSQEPLSFAEKLNSYLSLCCHYLTATLEKFHQHQPYLSKQVTNTVFSKLFFDINKLIIKESSDTTPDLNTTPR